MSASGRDVNINLDYKQLPDFVVPSSSVPANKALSQWCARHVAGGEKKDFIWHTAWPIALLGLLGHDIYAYYTLPNDRYSDNLAQILGGLPATHPLNYWEVGISSQQNWSNHLGSDLVGDCRYWIAAGIALGVPLLNWIIHCRQDKNINRDDQSLLLHFSRAKPDVLHDLFFWFLPNSLNYYARRLEQAEFSVLHFSRDELNDTERKNLFDGLRKIARNHNPFAQWHAISALSRLAATSEAKESIHCPHELLQDYSQQAWETLNDLAKKNGLISRMMAKHALWSIGGKIECKWEALFWLDTLYRYYAKFRLASLILQKTSSAIHYLYSKNECHGTWSYRPQTADYDCSICPDWDVYFRDTYTMQGCLNGLFARLRSPQEIVSKLSLLQSHPDFTDINIFLQQLSTWTESNFRTFLSRILQSGVHHLNSFNLSSPAYVVHWLQDNKIKLLADFLQHVSINSLSFNNEGIGTTQAQQLFVGFQNQTYELVDLSNNALSDSSMQPLAAQLAANETVIADLRLANNGITDEGISEFTPALRNFLLTSLDLSGNLFSDAGCLALSLALPQSAIKTLILNNIALSDSCLANLGTALSNTLSLQTISMINCNLGDADISLVTPYLSVSSLTSWNIANNQLTGQGFAVIAQSMQGAPLRVLNMGHNNIDVLSIGASYLPDTNVTTLAFQDNLFLAGEFIQFSRLIPNITKLEEIIFSKARLDSASIGELFNILTHTANSIKRIDLTENAMDDIAGQLMVNFLESVNNHLVYLNVANNLISGTIGNLLAKLFNQHETSLLEIDLSRTNLDTSSLQAIIRALPHTRVHHLYLNDLPVDDFTVNQASNWITPIPHFEELGNPAISIDLTRALTRWAQPNTLLQGYEFRDDQLYDPGIRTMCRLLAPMRINIRDVQLTGNSVSPEVNILNCHISAATTLTPWTDYVLKAAGLLSLQNIANGFVHTSSLMIRTVQQVLALPIPERYASLALPTPESYHLASSAPETPNRLSTQFLITGLAGLFLAYLFYRWLASSQLSIASSLSRTYRHIGLFGNSTAFAADAPMQDCHKQHRY